MATTNGAIAQLLTVPAAARWLGLGTKRLRRLVRDGEIPATTAGGTQPRLYIVDLEDWLRQSATRATPHAARVVAERLAREQGR